MMPVDPVVSTTKRRPTGSRLLTQFLLIILVSIGIDVGIDIYSGIARRSAVPAELGTQATAEAHTAATNLERTFDGARQLLSALASIPNIRDHDDAACAALRSIGRSLPIYDYISLRRLDGTLECSSIESPLNARADPRLLEQ